MTDKVELGDVFACGMHISELAQHIYLAFDRPTNDLPVKTLSTFFVGKGRSHDRELGTAKAVLRGVNDQDYPVYLHSGELQQPSLFHSKVSLEKFWAEGLSCYIKREAAEGFDNSKSRFTLVDDLFGGGLAEDVADLFGF